MRKVLLVVGSVTAIILAGGATFVASRQHLKFDPPYPDVTPMPWQALSRLTEDDLRSIYRYLKTVPPVKNDVGPAMVEEGKP